MASPTNIPRVANLFENPTLITIQPDLRQIWEWNAVVPAAVHRCVHDMFVQSVKARPTAPAVCAWDGDLCYAQLDRLASGLAARLIALGVAGGAFVPVCFEKSMWTAVAVLGVLKTGAAFVLLDPAVPELRLQTIVSQVHGSIIVCSQASEALSSRLAGQVVILGAHVAKDLYDQPPREPSVAPDPSSPMYVAFTSGSTGKPKGAIITHTNLASAIVHQERSLHITEASRVYDFSAYSFDVCICNMFATLTAGGCLCVPNELDRQNRLAESIASLGANTIDLTPSVSRLLQPEQVPSIEQIIFGGEALRIEHVTPWWGKVRIVSLYGPCECTPNSTINSHPSSPGEATHMGNGIGLNTWIVHAEDHNTLVPVIGDVGELLLEGPLVGSGYLKEPEKTAAAFIEDPDWLAAGGSPEQPGRRGRLYKTGDLVRYNKDGGISFVGRKDEQVKIRGQRVELGEIEHVLRAHPKVKDAAAVVVSKAKDKPESWLAGFVTVRDDEIGDEGARGGEEESQHVEGWEKQFDDDYLTLEGMRTESIGRDFMGWTSMYDGLDIDKGEMNEWLDDTISSIRNGMRPRHVLEIGTGSGMILFNLLGELQSYTGLEPSGRAVAFLTRITTSMPPKVAAKISMHKAAAADVGRVAKGLLADTVVLNSVIQYFPSLDYLVEVVQQLAQLQGVKTIFLGDVRSFPLYNEFLAARALYATKGKASKEELRRIIHDMKQAEAELLVDPAFFMALPDRISNIEHVEILPKRMRATNELSAYRYEAVIHVRAAGQPRQQVRELGQDQWVDFQGRELSRESLLEFLQSHLSTSSTALAVSNIPNGKTVTMSHVVAGLDSSSSSVGVETNDDGDDEEAWLASAYAYAQQQPSMSAADLVELAERTGSRVELSWARQSSQRGSLDAIFHRYAPSNGEARVLFRFPWDHHRCLTQNGPFCNAPVQRHQARRHAHIQSELYDILQARLPSYMLPQVVTILDKMPLNSNGKVDRRALAERTRSQTAGRDRGPARHTNMSALEEQIRNIWGEVLSVKPGSIGLDDSFFKLGGDSMTAMKFVGRARGVGLDMTVAQVFRYPKLRDIVRAVQ
ncbi:peramine synthetase [Cladorrhinum sp. PSN259]|nr:peramine synthetase [Cladorrhinum sp. PSN259]